MSAKHFIDSRIEEIKGVIEKWEDRLNIEEDIFFRFGEPLKGRSSRTYLIVEKYTLVLVIDPRITDEDIEIGIARELIYYLIHYRPQDLAVLALEEDFSEKLINLIQKTEGEKEQLDKKLENAVLSELMKHDSQEGSEQYD